MRASAVVRTRRSSRTDTLRCFSVIIFSTYVACIYYFHGRSDGPPPRTCCIISPRIYSSSPIPHPRPPSLSIRAVFAHRSRQLYSLNIPTPLFLCGRISGRACFALIVAHLSNQDSSQTRPD
ncbi:hypothetical protein VTO73DRAFT_3788 [Trametes versicolor]